jgi:phosphohistidine swiveling domain-containing protein
VKIIERWLDLPEPTRELLGGRRWDFASENHDDDFHTDVLFLRVSCGSMANFAGHASRAVLSYHDGFDARFFYEEQENDGVVGRLVERYFGDRPWRESIPDAIRDAAARLDAVWAPLWTPEALRDLSLRQLRRFYREQLAAHLKLYEPCWTAETLQAAGKGLTEALIRLLLAKNVPRERLFEIFNALTVTEEPSIFGAEQEALVRAATAIAGDPGLKALTVAHPARAKLYFDGRVLRLARKVSASSGVFAYHGFSQRRRASEEDVLERIVELVCDDARREREQALIERREAAIEARSELVRELGLGEDEVSLFRTYAELGNTKILRRMVQLHNFEFLDALLRELAIRMGTCEAVFHFMTPEEILGCIDRGQVEDEARYRQRAESMTFVIHEGEEFLLVGEASRACREAVAVVPAGGDGQLAGVPVSPGRARGRAVLAVRNDESLRRRFREGDVLVSVETDPDLVPIMRKASAIVTDQGGITSHAAIIARELGVPCITGVAGATTTIREGDLLIVDAWRGTVEILDAAAERPVYRLGDGVWPGANRTGAKAGVLHRLRQVGHPVPEGFLVSDYVTGRQPAPVAAIEDELGFLAAEDAGAHWAVRSSATCEDGVEHSQAGRFITRLGVATADVARAIDEIQREREDRATDQADEDTTADFELPVLVMRMVDATVSGVVFTIDPRRPDSGEMIVETTPGLCEALVSGHVRPRCAQGPAGGPLAGESWLSEEQSEKLLAEVARLQETLGEPALDIEFSFAGDRLFVLQARPLSHAQWGGGGGGK